MLRTAARVDGNQPEIKALRAIGASVLHVHQLKNCFDLLIGYRGRTFIFEIKDPAQPPSARQLTPGEAKCPEAARILRTAASATEGNAYQRWQGGEAWAVKEAVALSAVQAALTARDEQMRQALAGLLAESKPYPMPPLTPDGLAPEEPELYFRTQGMNEHASRTRARIQAAAAALGLGEL